jgi:MFS family permease
MSSPPAVHPQGGETPVRVRTIATGAFFALGVLFSMNLLNYVDRYVFAAVGPAVIRDLDLTKAQFGVLTSAFIVAYTVMAPGVGWLNDRSDRRKLMAFGVTLWSLATVAAAFARSFDQMLWARAILGVGEASYGVVAPTLLADFFDPRRRGKIMSLFYLALPVGTAIGYGLGGKMEAFGTRHAAEIAQFLNSAGLGGISASFAGWRLAFWVVGLPGLVIASLGLLIHEPGRGGTKVRPRLSDYFSLLRTPSYLFNTAGLAAVTFTTGAFGAWFPSYFEYVHLTKPAQKVELGIALAVAGILGVLIGMWGPDRLQQTTRRAYMIWSGVAVMFAVPIGAAGLLAGNKSVSLGLLAVASVLMSSCLGPSITVTANVVPAARRGVGYALSIFLLHLFGDIPSPFVIGQIADWLGEGPGATGPVGRFFTSINAGPVWDGKHMTNVTAGMLVIVPVLLIGSVCFLIGSRFLPRDQDRAQQEGHGAADHAERFH